MLNDRFQSRVEKTILYLNQLPENTFENDLKLFFKDYIKDIVLTQIDHTYTGGSLYEGKSRAMVVFKTSEQAKKAFNSLSMKKLRGNTVNIQYHKSQINPEERGYNLFVKGLPLNVSQRDIFEKFLSYGDIISSKICEDSEGNHLGYGYFNYSTLDAVNKILKDIENNVKFFNVNIQVAQFQKKNERITKESSINKKKNIYIKNIPINYTKDDLINIFNKYGNIEYSIIKAQPEHNAQFGIITYTSEESAKMAIDSENNKNGLYVDYLQTKAERKRIINNKIISTNFKLNSQYKKSNLHIRNIPKEVNEEILCDILKKFGEIKSLKIPKFILVSKLNNKIQEITQNKLFCYVCFDNVVSAQNAQKALNGKICPGYEKYINRPLIIENFMPKIERKKYLDNIFNRLNHQPLFFNNSLTPMMDTYPLFMHPTLYKHVIKGKRANKNYQSFNIQNININEQQYIANEAQLNELNKLKNDAEKRDYLGEIIFRNIEKHPIKQQYDFSIEVIGKITGMIIGIEDFNEIINIANDYNNLTLRINQAIELLNLKPQLNK